jgi:tetratricopeptide (TPR) repeat protein
MAEEALEKEKYDDAIGLMEKHIESNLEDTQGARVRYLLALALYHKTRLDIRECRERGEIGGRLKAEQADAMKRAERYFLESQDVDPNSDKADDCLYFAGVIQDYGCLNNFKDAKNTYKKMLDLYPESEHADDARYRLGRLDGHGKPGDMKKGGFH